MGVLDGLQPAGVFRFFEEISCIPRGSGNERGVSDYLVKFANDRQLFVYQDAALNVIIKKPGATGYEDSAPLIIQGHMDMVCEKNTAVAHDFDNDPIRLIIDGDYIKAKGTTLGADNGIAVAIGLALLDDIDIAHPPLEVLMTTNEEIGLEGAMAVECDKLAGRRMINLDCGGEGAFTVSCAGGGRSYVIFNIERSAPPPDYQYIRFDIKGLAGGHSGGDIHLGKANANVLAGRLLRMLNEKYDVRLAYIEGGLKDNAIPREARAVIAVNKQDTGSVSDDICRMGLIIKNEYDAADPDLSITCAPTQYDGTPFTPELTKKIAAALVLLPNGVQAMDKKIPSLVETSNNTGVVRTGDDEVLITNAVRSSVNTRKDFLYARIAALCETLGADNKNANAYPSWEYAAESDIRETCAEVYKAMYGKDPEIKGIHGGLECGVFAGKFPGIDMIAMGPDASGAHTPDEKLSVSSTVRIWAFLTEVLRRLK